MTNLFIVQRHGWMKTHDYISELITVNQSLHLTKDRFAWIILSYVILSELKENNRINLITDFSTSSQVCRANFIHWHRPLPLM